MNDCLHGDPTCPCRDGDVCHYEPHGDTPAARCPRSSRIGCRQCVECEQPGCDNTPTAWHRGRIVGWTWDSPGGYRAVLDAETAARCPTHATAWPVDRVDTVLVRRVLTDTIVNEANIESQRVALARMARELIPTLLDQIDRARADRERVQVRNVRGDVVAELDT